MKRFLLLSVALATLAACDNGGAVRGDAREAPPLNEMVEEPADWSSIGPAVGQTPNESAMLTFGPLVTDLDAMLAKDAPTYRKRMLEKGGKLTRVGLTLTSVTPTGPEAAYLVVFPPDHAMEAGWRTPSGWVVRRTAGADFAVPPAVAQLKAAP